MPNPFSVKLWLPASSVIFFHSAGVSTFSPLNRKPSLSNVKSSCRVITSPLFAASIASCSVLYSVSPILATTAGSTTLGPVCPSPLFCPSPLLFSSLGKPLSLPLGGAYPVSPIVATTAGSATLGPVCPSPLFCPSPLLFSSLGKPLSLPLGGAASFPFPLDCTSASLLVVCTSGRPGSSAKAGVAKAESAKQVAAANMNNRFLTSTTPKTVLYPVRIPDKFRRKIHVQM